MKMKKILYVLGLCLLMLTLIGATSLMAQDGDKAGCSKASQASCSKSAKQCTPAEKAACQTKKSCDTKSQKCDKSAYKTEADSNQDDSGN